MKSAVRIGANLSDETAAYAAGAVTEVMKAQFDFRSSDAVTLAALSTLSKAFSVENVSIMNCQFQDDSGQTKTVVTAPGGPSAL